MTHESFLEKDKKQMHPLHHPTRTGNPVMVEKADGVYLYTTDGRKILDAMAGLWNVNVGYGNKELPQVAFDQMQNLAYTSGFAGMSNTASADLADKLAGFAYPNLNFTHFTSGGSESSDTSFKTARYYWRQIGRPEKTKIISRWYGYHGITMAAMSATGMSKYQTMFGDLVPGFIHIPNPNGYKYEGALQEGETVAQAAAREFEACILREGPETVAAIIVEPIQGAGGVIVPDDGYFDLVQEICKKYEVLLIVDEVITGFGRTGKWFGGHHYDLKPDIMQFAKGVTSGYLPLGGIQVSDEIRDVILNAPTDQSWMHGYTYSGHSAACAVASANIDIIERDGLIENAAKMGERLLEGFQGLVDEFPHIDNARMVGLIGGFDVMKDVETREWDTELSLKIGKVALENGVRSRPLFGSIAFSPPLTISADEIDTIVKTMGDAIAATA